MQNFKLKRIEDTTKNHQFAPLLSAETKYLNEAVMKEEPEEGGAHAGVGADGTGHNGAHGGLERRAARGVERRRELLAVGCGGEEEKGGEEQAMAARGRSHGVLLAHTIIATSLASFFLATGIS